LSEQAIEVIVIGAGPAGLMAAGQAATAGVQTLLLERMERPGRKLEITGKGRCNLTNIIPVEEFLSHFGPQGSFLRQSFALFFNQDLIAFLECVGVETSVERGGRVFPSSGDARWVTDRLVDWALGCGVTLRVKTRARRVITDEKGVAGMELDTGTRLGCRCVVIACGGASYPATGSSGDGYRMAQALGHTLTPIRPALVPITTRGKVARLLQGVSLANIRVTVLADGKKVVEDFGEMMFTHFGISGPIILTLSGCIVDALGAGKHVSVSIDLKPALDAHKLEARLLRDLDALGKAHYRTLLKGLLPQKMIDVSAALTGIPLDKPCHQVTAAERKRLLEWLKDFRLEVSGHLPLEAAMVTAGGVSLKEVNPKTMESRLVPGLYFAGEVLDLAADTGGYNLQAAFSTGWAAGRAAAASLTVRKTDGNKK